MLHQRDIESRRDQTEDSIYMCRQEKLLRSSTAVLFRYQRSPLRCDRHKADNITMNVTGKPIARSTIVRLN